jgi:hypothetical protein
MNGKEIVKLAAEFAAGAVSADYISEQFGDGVLGAVLGIVGGTAVGGLTGSLLDAVDRETGIVSDIGGLVDDVFSIFD